MPKNFLGSISIHMCTYSPSQ